MAIIGKSAESIAGINLLQQSMGVQVLSGQHLSFSDQMIGLYVNGLRVSQYYNPQPRDPFAYPRQRQQLPEAVLQGIFANRIA